jgi:alkylation response protein AidB-like acyl-CoA dehydrogenase
MDFSFTPEQEAFRSELRAWLDRNAVEVFGEYGAPRFHANDQEWARLTQWHQRLYRAGYVALAWPKEWGGAGAGLVEQIIYQDEMSTRGLPPHGVAMQAITRFGPILMSMGTEQQRRRFLPGMISGDEVWCQGYSEPNAGSDLASLQTRAVLEGDHFAVNGQKVWTSHAHHSDFQVLLVRTDPDAPKHRGITYLLVDMHSPGITIRPLIQATGEHGFNEVFYDNVQVPRENVVGEINDGWKVTIANLMYERTSIAAVTPVERSVDDLVKLLRSVQFEGMPATQHPYVRQKVAQFAAEARCMRFGRYRALSSQIRGHVPGPESSFGKLFGTELNLRIAMFADEVLGPYAQLEHGSPAAVQDGLWVYRLFFSRAMVIGGGTNEIQRNIIGERVLRLPKG